MNIWKSSSGGWGGKDEGADNVAFVEVVKNIVGGDTACHSVGLIKSLGHIEAEEKFFKLHWR